MKLSVASLTAAIAVAVTPGGVFAVNFVIIQPDDMIFYDDWTPPPFLPWSNNYPGSSYPGNSTLPNINKLRDEGLEMTAAYAASPKCGTSRYSTVTGRYATRSSHGRKKAIDNGLNPSDASIPNTKLRDIAGQVDGQDCSQSNIAQVFRKNGYATGMVGKWHLSRTSNLGGGVDDVKAEIVDCGFTDVEAMYPDNLADQGWATGVDHNMEYVAYKAVEFIEHNNGTDWFLYVNPTVPHGPAVDVAMTKDCRITVDGDFRSNMTEGWAVDGMTAEFGNDCFAYRDNVKARAMGSTSDEDLGSIWVDDAIGAIYKALHRTNQLADTVILFQLDHGKAEKDKIWEGGVRIPQFIHYPDGLGTSPRTFDGMVSTIDIGPTMLDIAGINETTAVAGSWYSMDGKSWKAAIDNLNASGDEWKTNRCLFFESAEDRAVRCGCDKFMLLSASSPEAAEAIAGGWSGWSSGTTNALFDLCDTARSYIVADSSTESPEAVNIAAFEPQKATDMRGLLQCHIDRTDASNPEPLYKECTANIATPSPTVTPKPTLPVANGDLPECVDSKPLQNEMHEPSGSMVLNATVLDNDLQRVRFDVRLPDGTRTTFSAGTEVSTNGDESTHSFIVDTTTQSGKYGYRLNMQDFSGNSVAYPVDGGWIEFVVVSSAAEVVMAARVEIASIINDATPAGINLAAKFVRHGFHDCVGGCDGCVDMTNGDNAGLDVPIAALDPVVDMFSSTQHGVTRADIWVLAALEGAAGSQPDGEPDNHEFSMDWIGRPTCEDINIVSDCVDGQCTQERGPNRTLPSPDLDTHGLLEFFHDEFNFDETDTVAIMGAHTLGTLARENSGFNGPNGWLGGSQQLDNGYYDNLLGGDDVNADFEELMDGSGWTQVFVDNSILTTPDRWEWERGTDPHFVMVNSDIAIVRNLTSLIGADGEVDGCQFKCRRNNGNGCALPRCPHAPQTFDIVKEYKFNNTLWLVDFEAAFKRMLEIGDYDAGTELACGSPPCAVGSIFERRHLRGSHD